MPSLPVPLLPAVVGGAAAAVVVLLLLWLRAARRARDAERRADAAERAAAALAVSVTDWGGRLRIIRELHDVAVHRMGSMIAQADGARYAAPADPTAAVRAVQTIAEAGRTTLADMRRVMTLVRESEAEAAPRPTIASARDLARVMRDAGLRVRFEEAGEPYDLSAGAEVAVHRILQEALGNALQHGGEGTEVRVGLTWTATGLALQVDDDGFRTAVLARGLAADEEARALGYTVEDDLRALTREVDGAGIQEMRTRAELFGGTLTATEVPGVGFSISAVFPTIRHQNGVHGVELAPR